MTLSKPTIIRKPCCGKNCQSPDDPGEFGWHCSICDGGFCEQCKDHDLCKNGGAHLFQETTFLLSYAVEDIGQGHASVVGNSSVTLGNYAAIFPPTDRGKRDAERFVQIIKGDPEHRLEVGSREHVELDTIADRAIEVHKEIREKYRLRRA